MLKCSYITENGEPGEDIFNIDSKYVDIKNNLVKKEIKLKINGKWNLLPAGFLLYIHELVRY